jgi:hypothetical protein
MKTATNENDVQSKNEGQFGLVSDERMAELKEQLLKLLKEKATNTSDNDKIVAQKKR